MALQAIYTLLYCSNTTINHALGRVQFDPEKSKICQKFEAKLFSTRMCPLMSYGLFLSVLPDSNKIEFFPNRYLTVNLNVIVMSFGNMYLGRQSRTVKVIFRETKMGIIFAHNYH